MMSKRIELPRKVYTLFTMLICCLSLAAQGFQFSQMEINPILHHPTASVLQQSNQQLRLGYRTERRKEASYQNLLLAYHHKMNNFMLGGHLLQNNAGPASLQTTKVVLTSNYSQGLNANGDALVFGISACLVQRRLRPGDFQFDNQYVLGQGYDESIENGELMIKGRSVVPTLSTGVLLRKQFNRFETNAGLTLNSINRPEVELLEGHPTASPMEISFFSNISLAWNENVRGDVFLSYNKLSTFQEKLAGVQMTYSVSEQTDLQVGLANRFEDALIIQVGGSFGATNIMLSYDFGHRLLPDSRGVVELSATYNFITETIRDPRTFR